MLLMTVEFKFKKKNNKEMCFEKYFHYLKNAIFSSEWKFLGSLLHKKISKFVIT